ncbi:carbohydrate-binding protein [Cerasicoccus fimbriatus]|uniref:carbohydrate-binding protein n=1 Tax=Cerasicoccus fimbriatus TaxID=3014554 RepID=UPI0022B4E48A|nr:carbohydrate-binding protein [Cerasicoccus sp. TK19100]
MTIATAGGSSDAPKITEEYGVTYLNWIFGSNTTYSNIPDPSVQDSYYESRTNPSVRSSAPSTEYPFTFISAGVAMDEWIYNSTHPEVYDWIQTGLTAGKTQNKEVFVANWLAHVDADQVYDMTQDGTIDLNMVQVYELTVQQGIGLNWNHGLSRLEEFQQRGLIRKTVLGFGHITDQAGWNNVEWTESLLRSRMEELKRKFPEMPGVAFFSYPAGNQSDMDNLVSLVDELSGEYWPELPIPDGLYSMTPQVDTQQRVDAYDSGTSNGTDVVAQVFEYPNLSPNQFWRFTHLGDSVYKIQPAYADHLALDVSGASNSNGANVQLWTDNGSNAQKWKLSKIVGGFQLRPLCSPDKFLMFHTTTNGTQAQIWTQLTNYKQAFAITPEVLPTDHVPPYYQMENATLSGGAYTSSTNVGSMGGYIGMPATGASASLNNVDGGRGGLRALRFRYASGFSDARTMNLSVNGNAQTLTLPPTGSWQDWETQAINIPLNAGTDNTIILSSSGVNPPAIDKLTIGLPVYQCEDAALSGGAYVSSSNPGSDGAAVGMPATGAALTWSNVEGGSGGVKGLKIRYLSGFTDNRVVNLTVNGATTQVTFPPTGDWSTWHELTVYRTLNAGTSNTIAIGSAGTNTPGFDRMKVDINPDIPKYQWEYSTLSGGTYSSNANSGAMGDGYIGMPTTGTPSASLSFVDGGSGGLREFRFRYASGYSDTRTMNVSVNGNVHTLTLPPTGGWQNWETQTLNIPLNAGTNNTIILTSAGAKPPAMDELTFGIPVYQCEDAALSGGAYVSSSNSGSDGAAVGMPATGAALTWSQVEGGTGGLKGLKIRYVNGFTDGRVVNLTINGATTQITLPPTGDWNTWHEYTTFQSLNSGATNTIAIGSAGTNTPGFDRMKVNIQL